MFTYPSASGVTVMEALSVGTPFVVYEGLSLGMTMRIEKGYIRELGINESCCVAHTLDGYVGKVVRLGTDPVYRKEVSDELVRRVPGRMFENENVINDWVEFLYYTARNKKPEKHRPISTPGILGSTWDRSLS